MEKKQLKLYTSLVITTHKYCLKLNISELNSLLCSFDSYLAWPKVKTKQHVTAILLEVTKPFFFTSNTADELHTIKPETRLDKSELWHSYKKR